MFPSFYLIVWRVPMPIWSLISHSSLIPTFLKSLSSSLREWRVGLAPLVSQRWTVERLTSTSRAKSSCPQPIACRSSFTFSLNSVIFSQAILGNTLFCALGKYYKEYKDICQYLCLVIANWLAKSVTIKVIRFLKVIWLVHLFSLRLSLLFSYAILVNISPHIAARDNKPYAHRFGHIYGWVSA